MVEREEFLANPREHKRAQEHKPMFNAKRIPFPIRKNKNAKIRSQTLL